MAFLRSCSNSFIIVGSKLILFLLTLLLIAESVNASRTTNSYDGNIYPLYAGNGSLVPPPISLGEALKNHRIIVLAFYLDDSAESKIFAPVLSEVQRLWGRSIELIILPTDPLQWQSNSDPLQPAYYWHGRIPQVVVIDKSGTILMDEEGQVPIEIINKAISRASGRESSFEPKESETLSFNELNSELVSQN
uniref:Thioredoxin domain-containing protein n=1 Tax=Paulinella micropora TaxID=1928728 RepID=A0A1L5YAZ2_9EUKA|nr:hypothetical protein PCKR_063 [Paulinella micropora]AQX44635.1 hypothetical protein PFK_063 [Paulinella micropora]